MRIVRAKHKDTIFYGIVDEDLIRQIDDNIFAGITETGQTHQLAAVHLLAPLEPKNVIAIGLNYTKHALENGRDIPTKPVIFLKATSSVIGPEDAIVLPKNHPDHVDFEVELAIIIGKTAKDVEEADALDYVFGYTCANDVSARDCQMQLDVQWARGKSFDTFCPIGPWIETELHPGDQPIKSIVNGVVMQDSNTSDMIFSVPYLISYCSKNMTLLPGTVIMTGTPEGVGVARNPQVFLRNGDTIEIEIGDIGSLKSRVIG